MTRARLTLGIAESSILGLTAVSFALSYSAQRRLAAAHGYSGWEATLWPLLPDLLALSTTMIALALAARGHGPTGEAWFMAGLSALVTLGGNVLSVGKDPIGIGMHACTAVFMVGAWHLFFRSIEARPDSATTGDTSGQMAGSRPVTVHFDDQDHGRLSAGRPAMTAALPAPSNDRPEDPDMTGAMTAEEARRAVVRMVKRASSNGRAVTVADVMRMTGRSQRQARRLLAAATAEVAA